MLELYVNDQSGSQTHLSSQKGLDKAQTPSNRKNQDLRWSHEASASKDKSRTVDFIVPMLVDRRQHDGSKRKQTLPEKVIES
jgi:hypothetical protein